MTSSDEPAKNPKTWIRETSLAAIIGSVVALMFSPILEVITFNLTRYLSRPVPSVEYVELVMVQEPVDTPVTELQQLFAWPSMQMFLMQNPAQRTNIMSLATSPASLTSDRIAAITETLEQFDQFLSDPATASGAASNPYAYGAYAVADPKQRENEAKQIRNLLAQLEAQQYLQTFFFKISVLNRGGTDGLIRGTGSLDVNGHKLPVTRSSGPKQTNASALSAVPVMVTNEPEEIRASSVGQIKAHTMAEFWFCVDTESLPLDEIQAISQTLEKQTSPNYKLKIF